MSLRLSAFGMMSPNRTMGCSPGSQSGFGVDLLLRLKTQESQALGYSSLRVTRQMLAVGIRESD
jgi:hypothetical protein